MQGTNSKVDGSFVATVLETAAVGVLYLAWRSITEGTASIPFGLSAHRGTHTTLWNRGLGRNDLLPAITTFLRTIVRPLHANKAPGLDLSLVPSRLIALLPYVPCTCAVNPLSCSSTWTWNPPRIFLCLVPSMWPDLASRKHSPCLLAPVVLLQCNLDLSSTRQLSSMTPVFRLYQSLTNLMSL